MRRIAGNVLPRSIVMVLTAFAVMACFSLAVVEPLRAADSTEGQAGALSREAYYFFPVQHIDPVLFPNTDDSRVTLLRIDFHRFLAPWEEDGTGNILFPSQFWSILKGGFASTKDTILLKLRI